MDAERTPDEAVTDPPVSTPPAAGTPSAEPRMTEAAEPRTAGARPPQQRPAGRPRSAGSHQGTGEFRIPDPRPAVAEPTVPTNIYRARRPAVAVFLVIPAIAVGLLLVRALAVSAFGKPFLIDGVIASSLGLASLPLLVAGLYGLITGAAHGAEQWGFRVWAKPPLAYLVVGIVFVLATAVAIR